MVSKEHTQRKGIEGLMLWTGLCFGTLGSLVLYSVFPSVRHAIFEEEKVAQRDPNLPAVGKNQSLILHPGYLKGTEALGYTLLTDQDRDGQWDIAEKVHVGFTTGDASRRLYFKKGYGPSRDPGMESGVVGPEFFKPYQ